MATADQIRRYLHFCTEYKTGIVSYCIEGTPAGDSWQKIILIFNGNRKVATVAIPEGNYKVVAKGDAIDEKGIGQAVSNEITVESISMLLLVRD
jgi:pullulanase